MRIVKRLLLVLAMIAGLLALPSATPPAAATHTCYVQLWEHVNYEGDTIYFGCPGTNSTLTWSDFGSLGCCGWDEKASSMKIHLPSCNYNAKLWRDPLWMGYSPSFGGEGLWGPPFGDGTWHIADLRPYGWNDSFSALTIHNKSSYC